MASSPSRSGTRGSGKESDNDVSAADADVRFAIASTASLSRDEVLALDVGLADGRRERRRLVLARASRGLPGAKEPPLANSALEALRAFGALAATVRRGGRDLSLTLLEANGFSSFQITAALELVAARLGAAR